MAFQPAPLVWGVELRFTQNNQEVENTLYFRRTVPAAEEQAADLAAALSNWYAASLRPIQSNQVTLREIYVRDLGSNEFIDYTLTFISGNVGERTSPAMPNNVTLSVSFRTGIGGRTARGRNYFIGLTDNQVTNNNVEPSEATLIVAAYEDIIADVNSVELKWCVVSRYLNKTKRTEAVSRDVTAVALANTVVDSQRRRLPGRGK